MVKPIKAKVWTIFKNYSVRKEKKRYPFININLFVKKHRHQAKSADIFYNSETAEIPKEATFEFLDACEHV